MKRTHLLAAAVISCTAYNALAGQIWQSTFDTTADGVVDIKNNNSAKVMIGPVNSGRLQITAMDNATNAYTPDKAGRPLGSTKSGGSSFSALYEFNWSALNQDETPQGYELAGFLGNATPQTRQVTGALMRHWKVGPDYYVAVDCGVGSVGASDFGYKAGAATYLGTDPLGVEMKLEVGYDGSTHELDLGLYDSFGIRMGGQHLDLDTDVPGLTHFGGVAAELGALALTHVGWEDYTGDAFQDIPTVWQVNRLTYFDDPTGAINLATGGGTPGPASWKNDLSGNWSDAANWTAAVPNAVDATANFGTVITSARSVTADGSFTVGTMNFTSPISYTINGANAITMDVTTGSALMHVTAGSHTINTPLNLNDSTSLSVDAGAQLTLGGDLTGTVAVSKDGPGALNVKNVRAGALSINAGTVTVLANGAASGTSKVTGLTIAAGATLDINNNALAIDYTGATPKETIRQLILSGFNSGGWNGTGIMSTFAQGSANPGLAVGYAEASDIYTSFPANFNGQTITDNTTFLIRMTAFGDANLDGKVDSLDFNALASSFGTSSVRWSQGDFNYDNKVDSLDFNALAANFGQPPVFGPSAAASVVPEPATIGLLSALAGLSCIRRTR